MLRPRGSDVANVIRVDDAVPIGVQEADVSRLGVRLKQISFEVDVAVDVGLRLEDAIGLIADKVTDCVAFRHPGDGGVAHRPSPTVQVTRFAGYADDLVAEVGVVEVGVELEVALSHSVSRENSTPSLRISPRLEVGLLVAPT